MNKETAIYKKVILTEIAIIRPILIVLLVFYHAFAIYSGAWKAIAGFPDIKIYWWLDKLSYAFMLEMFVLISGFVFGFQVRTKGVIILNAKYLFWNKFKRLIIPSLVFSLLYIILFRDIHYQSANELIYSVIAGTGHMWFLPMLFWCFAFLWVIERLHLRPIIVLLYLFFLSVCSFVPLPFQMGHTLYYMLFFYTGYLLQKCKINLNRLYNLKVALILSITFLFLFVTLTLFIQVLCGVNGGDDSRIIMKVLRITLIRLSKIAYSSVGIASLFAIVGVVERFRSEPLDYWLIELGNLSMGVYLFQQFILKALYNYTTLSFSIGPYLLPWVGFVVALCGSLLLSWFFRKTRIGKFLIG